MKCLSCGCDLPLGSEKCPECGELIRKQMQLTGAPGSTRGKNFEQNDVNPMNRKQNLLLAAAVVGGLLLAGIVMVTLHNKYVTWGILIALVALCAFFAVKEIQKTARWKVEGLLIDREKEFYLRTEIFTTQKVSFERVIEEIKKGDYALSQTHWETNHDGKVEFVGYNALFKATLLEERCEDPAHSEFKFFFKNFNRDQDPKLYEDRMNLLLTQIEKAVLRVDPDTQIRNG